MDPLLKQTNHLIQKAQNANIISTPAALEELQKNIAEVYQNCQKAQTPEELVSLRLIHTHLWQTLQKLDKTQIVFAKTAYKGLKNQAHQISQALERKEVDERTLPLLLATYTQAKTIAETIEKDLPENTPLTPKQAQTIYHQLQELLYLQKKIAPQADTSILETKIKELHAKIIRQIPSSSLPTLFHHKIYTKLQNIPISSPLQRPKSIALGLWNKDALQANYEIKKLTLLQELAPTPAIKQNIQNILTPPAAPPTKTSPFQNWFFKKTPTEPLSPTASIESTSSRSSSPTYDLPTEKILEGLLGSPIPIDTHKAGIHTASLAPQQKTIPTSFWKEVKISLVIRSILQKVALQIPKEVAYSFEETPTLGVLSFPDPCKTITATGAPGYDTLGLRSLSHTQTTPLRVILQFQPIKNGKWEGKPLEKELDEKSLQKYENALSHLWNPP